MTRYQPPTSHGEWVTRIPLPQNTFPNSEVALVIGISIQPLQLDPYEAITAALTGNDDVIAEMDLDDIDNDDDEIDNSDKTDEAE